MPTVALGGLISLQRYVEDHWPAVDCLGALIGPPQAQKLCPKARKTRGDVARPPASSRVR